MKEKYLQVKVFPSVGEVFYVLISENVEDIDSWIEEHFSNIEFYEISYNN